MSFGHSIPDGAMRGLLMIMALAVFIAPGTPVALAAPPATLSYQGLLRDSGGAAVPDGDYDITFRLFAAQTGGATLWTEAQVLAVTGGIFNAVLGSDNPLNLPFDDPYWLSVQVGNDPELTPRVPLTSVPYARRAAVADVGEDSDWIIAGDDLSHEPGTVRVGVAALAGRGEAKPDAAGRDRDRQASKLEVFGAEGQPLYAQLTEADAAADQRAAILGYRTRSTANDGADYSFFGTNNAVTGANYWGDVHTFGVAGYSYNDFTRTGGVLGSNWFGDTWGSLGYRDESGVEWGFFTPVDAFVGGSARMMGMQLLSSPSVGYVLTADAAGNGSWQPATGLSLPYAGAANSAGAAFQVSQAGGGDAGHFEITGGGGSPAAVYGKSAPSDFNGIGGNFVGGIKAVQGLVTPTGSEFYAGVWGITNGGSGINYGIWGAAYGSGTNYAGFFAGDVAVTHNLSKGGGSFKIDHPLDPEGKYLYHSFVESPDMKNIYDGTVPLDESGAAWVDLPEWFEALNRDFRYQLTCIGGFAPVYVAEKIADGRFRIAGGRPGLEVSWQVTGIRHDRYAEMYRIPVEQDKAPGARGRYLHPEAHGKPEFLAENYEHRLVTDTRR